MKFTEQTYLVCFIGGIQPTDVPARVIVVYPFEFLCQKKEAKQMFSQQTQNQMLQLGAEAHNSNSLVCEKQLNSTQCKQTPSNGQWLNR